MAAILPNLKLYYFTQVKGSTTIGRGDFIRLLIEDAGLDYEYVRFTAAEWKEKKAELTQQGISNPTMPYITVDGKYFGKTIPCMRYIAKSIGNYYGKTNEEEHFLESTADIVSDWAAKYVPGFLFPANDDIKKKYEENDRLDYHKYLDKVIGSTEGPYVLGERITYVDFLIYHLADDDTKTVVDEKAYPHLHKLLSAVRARPSLKKHFDSLA